MKWKKQKHQMLVEFKRMNIHLDKSLFDKLKTEIPTVQWIDENSKYSIIYFWNKEKPFYEVMKEWEIYRFDTLSKAKNFCN